MPSFSSEKIQEMTKAHYALQVGCYLKETVNLGGAVYSIGKYIDDSYWNYASLVRVKSDEAKKLVEQVEKFSKENGRKSAFYLDPETQPTNFVETLESAGFASKDHEIWMLHSNGAEVEKVGENTSIHIELVKSNDQMERFVELFNAGFGMSTDAYGKSLHDAFKKPTKGVEILHYLANLDGKECGVASLYSSGKTAGIYNVTTLEEYRCRGVGTALNKRAILDSLKRKHDLLILQTEENGDAYRIYERMGFQPGFVASIYQKA